MSSFDALRQAPRSLTPERTASALDRALRAWEASDSIWCARLAQEHSLYSNEVIRTGILRGVENWTREALLELHAREVSASSRIPELTAVCLAGSIPTASFLGLLLPLLAGSSVYAKAASADPVSPRLFAESLREADPALGACIEVGDDASLLTEADAIIAYGSDETIRELRRKALPGQVFVGYGHKVSLASIGPEADLARAARDLALDVALWDGRGCLSPAWALVDESTPGRTRAFSLALAEELARMAEELPRGPLSMAEEMRVHELRASAATRAGVRVEMSKDSTDWTVLVETSAQQPAPGVHRLLPVIPVEGLQGLSNWCARLTPHLSSLGQSGWGDREPELLDRARDFGISRVCSLGHLQLPRLDWQHDGMDPIRPLLGVIAG
ncbi:MAG: hypothetical protein GY725_18645 [bacterium]|nr:hypothetical protein [bacterium]